MKTVLPGCLFYMKLRFGARLASFDNTLQKIECVRRTVDLNFGLCYFV